MIENLEKQNNILRKSIKSSAIKNEKSVASLNRQIATLKEDVEEFKRLLSEKDKEAKGQMVRLREFMQRNMKILPIQIMTEVEDILEGRKQEDDVYGLGHSGVKSYRRMAGVYKKIRKIEEKRQEYDSLPSIELKRDSKARAFSSLRHSSQLRCNSVVQLH